MRLNLLHAFHNYNLISFQYFKNNFLLIVLKAESEKS